MHVAQSQRPAGPRFAQQHSASRDNTLPPTHSRASCRKCRKAPAEHTQCAEPSSWAAPQSRRTLSPQQQRRNVSAIRQPKATAVTESTTAVASTQALRTQKQHTAAQLTEHKTPHNLAQQQAGSARTAFLDGASRVELRARRALAAHLPQEHKQANDLACAQPQ